MGMLAQMSRVLSFRIAYLAQKRLFIFREDAGDETRLTFPFDNVDIGLERRVIITPRRVDLSLLAPVCSIRAFLTYSLETTLWNHTLLAML
jgi:hypothetical protein